MYPVEYNPYTNTVASILKIDDITSGDAKQKYLFRYRGSLYMDSVIAYDTLEEKLRPLNATPLFRRESNQDVVYLVEALATPKPSRIWINIVLFIFTVVSVILTGALTSMNGPAPSSLLDYGKMLLGGVPFAASLLAILLAHEFGHYLVGRYHHAPVSLPYFLPLPYPISPFGTMGAFINMKAPPKNRRILMDIAIAGPLAGLVVAIPLLFLGLSLSKIGPLNPVPNQELQMEGNSLLYLLAKFIIFGKLLPAPTSYSGVPPLLYWLRYFFTGKPFPWGGLDVMIHPIAWAGWAGLLVTSVNLIPAGQLDGGHLLYVLLGKRTQIFLPIILLALLGLGLFWNGWWLWAFLIFLLGRIHAEPLDQITQIDLPRKMLAVLGLIIFILVFIPVPLILVMPG